MKKISRILLGVLAITLSLKITTNVFAASGTAMTVGSDYGSSSSTFANSLPAIRKATTHLTSMGYTTLKYESPTVANVKAGMNRNILYFAGHANATAMYFNNGTAINNSTSSGVSCSGYTCVGVGSGINAFTLLTVFMGCQTASGSSNIAQYAYSRGAKASLGWTTSIPSGDAEKWTDYFLTKMKTANLLSALSYANSQIWIDSRIKNTQYYGNFNATVYSIPGSQISAISQPNSVNSYSTETETNSNLDLQKTYILNENIETKGLSFAEKKLIISDVIRKNVNINFNDSDYIVERAEMATGSITKIYDFYFTINGIKTNIGYTVFLNENEDVILTVFDNMKGYDDKELKSENITGNINSKVKLFSESSKSSLKSRAMLSQNNKLANKTLVGEFKYYDVIENKLYYYFELEENIIGTNSKSIDYYFEEI